MENVGMFYDHLEYFMDVWYILWAFGIFHGHLVKFVVIWYIFQFWYVWSKTNLASLLPL
jgi:hypothetical protein